MITKESANFPKEELYGMTMQLRCAAVSVACNVAEGAARGSRKEFTQFLPIALGSYPFALVNLNLDSRLERMRKMVTSLIKSPKASGGEK